MNGTTAQHPHIAQSIANLSDESAKMIQITRSLCVESQFADATVEFLGPVVGILGLGIGFL